MRRCDRAERVGLSILFVNHDSWVHLARALESLIVHPPTDRTWEVVVVDDASQQCDPEGAARVRNLLAEIDGTFLVRKEIGGYAAGMNMARRVARGRLLLVCHPDVRFQRGCIDRLTAHHDANPGSGAVVPEAYADVDLVCRLPAGEFPNLSRHVAACVTTLAPGLAARIPRRRLCRQIRAWGASSAVEVDAVTDACFLVGRKLTDRIGFFDERFPLHYEGADFSHRLHRAGRAVVQVPGARIVHFAGGSSSDDPRRAARMRAHSRREYYLKWYGRAGCGVHDAGLALLHSRWARARLRGRRPRSARPVTLERGRPVLHLPRSSESFLALVGFDPWFHQFAGVFGRGAHWSPGEALLRRLAGPVWFRVLDLAGGPVPVELGLWVHEPEVDRMFVAPHELERGG